jgi:hypothetical protein
MNIPVRFLDGPLAGQSCEVELEKHDHTDRKTGAQYIRLTEARDGQPVSFFVLRETAYAQTKNETAHANPVRRYYLRSAAEIQADAAAVHPAP